MQQAEFIELFNALPDWQERYKYIIELGDQLPAMPENLKVPANRISCCPSRLHFHVSRHPAVLIQAEGNSPISVGLAGMLALLFNGLSPAELAAVGDDFYINTGLSAHLSSQRQAALAEMLCRLRLGKSTPC